VKQLANAQGELPAYMLEPSIERAIEASVEHGELNSILTLAPDAVRDILVRLGRKIEKNESAVVIASAGSRHFLRQLVEATFPNLTVLSHNEVPPEVKVRSRGVID
jgi:flagellar biosynthesis protein FlhA